jgi:bifunctional N-acetylglucosamine-1-phosphate-uridyltransferase/glucosamine-1-phosphate-acetyltransferase GlmU-like protein
MNEHTSTGGDAPNPVGFSDVVAVILAAGKGRRMGAVEQNKVCYPVAGRPAILRAMEVYRAAGIRRFLVVVGALAEPVMRTVTEEYPETTYVFQPRMGGTGHAAQVAVQALAAQGWTGRVMITMGDKVPRVGAIQKLFKAFDSLRPDLLVSVLPKAGESSAGRMVTDAQGRVCANVEYGDLRKARELGHRIRLKDLELTPDEVEARSPWVNGSLYLYTWSALTASLKDLKPDNVQGELYLTDTIEILSRTGRRVELMPILDPTELMTFNTPADLAAIEAVLSRSQD